jgi:hypothetical protein
VRPAVDGVVVFCEVVADNGQGDSGYVPIVSTIVDSDGAYYILVGDLDPNKTYALRARGVEGTDQNPHY